MQSHVDEDDAVKHRLVDSPGRRQTYALIQCTGSSYKTQAIFVIESGLYSLIRSSKLLNKNTLQEKWWKDI